MKDKICYYSNYVNVDNMMIKQQAYDLVYQNGYNLKYLDKIYQNDEEIVLQAVLQNNKLFKYASNYLRNNKLFVLKIIELTDERFLDISYISSRLKNDNLIIKKAINRHKANIIYASYKIKKELMRKTNILSKITFQYMPSKFKKSKHFILKNFNNSNNGVIPGFSKKLKNDKDVIIAGVKNNINSLKNASDKLKNDRNFIKELLLMTENPYVFIYASEKLRSDKELFLLAMSYSVKNTKNRNLNIKNNILSSASLDLQQDKEILIQYNFMDELELLSEDVKNNKEKVLQLVRRNYLVFQFCQFRNDKMIVWQAIKNDLSLFKYVSPELKNDKSFIIKAIEVATVSNVDQILQEINKDLLRDKEISKKLIERGCYCKVHNEIKNDEEITLKVLSDNGYNILYISKEIRNDNELFNKYSRIALKTESSAILYASPQTKNDRKLINETIENYPETIRYIPSIYIENTEVIKRAIRKEGKLLAYAPTELKNDMHLVFDAVKQDETAIKSASEEIKKQIGDDCPIIFFERYFGLKKLKNNLENKLDIKKDSRKKQKI